MKKISWFAALCCACLLAGCDASAQSDNTANAASQASATAAKPVRNLLLNRERLHEAQMQLMQMPEFKGKTVYVFDHIDFFDGERPRIELAVQDPKQPEKLVVYAYEAGKWSVIEAEDASEGKPFARRLFALNQADFSLAAAAAQTWQRKAQEVHAVIADPYLVTLVWRSAQKDFVWQTVTMEAVGAQYYLSCHTDGSVWEFRKK